MNIQEIMDKLETLPSQIQTVGEQLAEARGYVTYMREFKKIIFSQEFSNAMNSEDKKTVTVGEAEAYNSMAYRTHIVGLEEAEKNLNKAQAIYEARKAEFDACRSLLALEKRMVSIDTNQN